MGKVVAQLAMSLDGFVADRDDVPGPLFRFYEDGPVPVNLSVGYPELHVSQVTADLLTSEIAKVGATIVGRRLYDITNGWDGHTGGEVPMVVLTHDAPDHWPRGGVPIYFESSVESAMQRAQELAGDKHVSVAGATACREVLDAGLLDEVVVSLVPLIMGDGVPWFAGAQGPVELSDPEIVADEGVTHLRYQVRK